MNKIHFFALGLVAATKAPTLAMEKALSTITHRELCRDILVLGARLIIAAHTINIDQMNSAAACNRPVAGAAHTQITEDTMEKTVGIMAKTLSSQRTAVTHDQLSAHLETLREQVRRQETIVALLAQEKPNQSECVGYRTDDIQ